MSLILSDTVLKKVNSIADFIMQSPLWKSYQAAELAMRNHAEVQPLMEQLRKKQEARSKLEFQLLEHPKLQKLDEEIEVLLTKLEEFPEVTAFQQLQTELGECLSGVTRVIGWTVEGLHVQWDPPAGSCSLPG